MAEKLYDVAALTDFAFALFKAAGLEPDKARTVAEILVEADMMGHTTHGLALAPWYLESIRNGVMTRSGAPKVVSDRGACVTWDGLRLPGAWLTVSAMDLAVERAATYGTVTVAIGNSHHIGCLAAYLTRATDRGFVALLASSSPSGASVAPFGGTQGVFTPNPIAAGIPTGGDPILIDVSASITTNNMSSRLIGEGRTFEHQWLLDRNGNPTNDPKVLNDGGTILPAGGLDHGQKGYALAILVEALTQGLAGFGRVDGPAGTNAAVYLQVIDPTAFAGDAAFVRQTGWLADACRKNPPRPGVERVRLPGESSIWRKQQALADGLALHEGVFDKLKTEAERLGVEVGPNLQAQ
ncbi:Ldh family oxidoreductase [Aminobacter sp. AP02]|uniref:Ldh family oxidoreductase n=1 Tax=Aminobacter sp. AP02 TaxID=2135737 RepID=UPI000D6C9321|nr:Ldh family oxidoreductase [Aminobacter sp. AP02]PWK66419.1 L-lactate dehydrogenase [Aminobacter sp. AP02]